MIRRLYQALSGVPAVRLGLMVIIAAAATALLIVFYEWLGTLLDSGGGMG